MKKILLTTIMIIVTYPVFATCNIENDTACTVANMDNTLQNSVFHKNLRDSNSETQNTQSTFSRNEGILGEPVKTFTQKSNNYSYNTNCQFGICNETGTPKLFEK